MNESTFDRLVKDADQARFAGWDFSYLRSRLDAEPLPWDYPSLAREAIPTATSLLDMGTGGGEMLASFAPLPPRTRATEGYPPNVILARERLASLGVEVIDTAGRPNEEQLPFPDGEFDLIIDRHEYFHSPSLARVLRPGGRFITQQVGGRNFLELNEWLQAHGDQLDWGWWTLDYAVGELEKAGLRIDEAREVFPKSTFRDIAGVVYYLRAVPWQVDDFSVNRFRDRLLAMHQHIEEHGGLDATSHGILIRASKPG